MKNIKENEKVSNISEKPRAEINKSIENPDNDISKASNKGQSDVGEFVSGGNIDKIREILFGSQARDYEKRFTRLEDRILKEINDLREETRIRYDSLENYVKKELETLSNRLTVDQEELKDTSNILEKKIKQVDEHVIKNASDLRKEILDQFKILSDEIRKKHEETTLTVDQVADELRAKKVSHSHLSELFSELAMRLNNERIMELNLDIDKPHDE